MGYINKCFFWPLLLSFFFILNIFFIPSQIFASTYLSTRFEKAEKGDFIVTLENSTYTILAVQSISFSENGGKIISLAEISIPQNMVDTKTFSWRDWAEQGSPKNISYNIYDIDIKKCSLLRCYSVTKNCFFSASSHDNFFTKLLTLPLEYLPDQKRKKIGAPPLDDSLDTRAIWNPPQIIDGTRQKRPIFALYQTTWPKDGTDLSGKVIDLYFDKDSFLPFPYWIQVSNGNIEVMLKIIDSGKSINCKKKYLK